MAGFCTKCGIALAPATKFCTACGAAVEPSAQPTAAPPTVAVPARPPQSSQALKVILIGFAVFAGVVLLGGLFVGLGLRHAVRNAGVKVDEKAGSVQIETPKGTVTIGQDVKIEEAELGVPIYPGATRQEGSMRVATDEGHTVTVSFQTSDAPEKVITFYREKLSGAGVSVISSEDGAVITGGKEGGAGFVVSIGRGESGGSVIGIVRRGAKGAQ
jgi:hypothetical protein